MRKKDILSRRKFTTNTYMKEAIDYDIVIEKEEDLFITIKKYKNMSGTFTLHDSDNSVVTYIDKDYFVVELTPLNENYNIRYYFDSNKKLIDYYIDITYENGVEYKIPYYVDLYLDIIHYPSSDEVTLYDEDELELALKNKIISKKDYNMAYRVGNRLLKEIKNKSNKYFNIDASRYIDKYFNSKNSNYKVITLCGSTKFKDEFLKVQKDLTLKGNIVISVGLFGHSGDNEVWEYKDDGTYTKTKAMLDDMHKRKIDMSDEIYVINVGGYIGESTKEEIEYAIKQGKKVNYLENNKTMI